MLDWNYAGQSTGRHLDRHQPRSRAREVVRRCQHLQSRASTGASQTLRLHVLQLYVLSTPGISRLFTLHLKVKDRHSPSNQPLSTNFT